MEAFFTIVLNYFHKDKKKFSHSLLISIRKLIKNGKFREARFQLAILQLMIEGDEE